MTDFALGGNPGAEPMPDAAVPIERLLAHRAWVRAVARALSRGDESGADDLEQDAWVAALGRPPRHDASLRGWLGAVVRRTSAMRHRADARRGRRESAAARPEGGGRAADDVVAEAESHARLAHAVVALPEPERTAILLRFFEGLPPREVAARTGVPVETTRSRIKRALALLRESLGGDDDDRWALAVAPLLRPRNAARLVPWTAAAAAGSAAMGLGAKLGAAAVVALAGAAAWWALRGSPADDVPVATAPSVTSVPATQTSPPGPRPRARAATAPATDADPSTAVAETAKTAARSVRWKILPGDVPAPADGTVLPVEQESGSVSLPSTLKTVRVDGGDLVADEIGGGTVHGFAVAPDGARAKLFAKDFDERGPDTSFLRERKIVVTLVEPDGRPAAGVALQCRDQGHNAIWIAVVTDAEGRAEFAGLSPLQGLVDVYLSDENRFADRWIGTVNVRERDARVTWTIPAARDVTLRITVDGERRIPPGFRVSSSSAIVGDRRDDESAGTVSVRARPSRDGKEFPLGVSADGRASATCLVPAGFGPVTVDVTIPRGVTFVGRVLGPPKARFRVAVPGLAGGYLNVVLEAFDETTRKWSRTFPASAYREGFTPDTDGVVRIPLLRPGSYRLRDETTGVASTGIALSDDGLESPVVTLDLTGIGLLRGYVEVPSGDASAATVVVEGVPDLITGDAKRRTVPALADGSFRTWVPGDRALHLRVEHPVFRADAANGIADVTGPTDGVALRLVVGPTISFRLPGIVAKGTFHAPSVRFFRGEPSGDAVFTRTLTSDDDHYRVGGVDAGTWTLWIDAPDRAPKILRDVVLGDGSIDLGDVDLDDGLSLCVRIATLPGESAPRVGVSASKEDGVAFFRFTSSNGESVVTLKGLVPGTYDVNVYPQAGPFHSDSMTSNEPPFLRTKVVLDASRETTIDYSPR
jgi:RNA polymerase sigma-70 factor (ECF subfamily)